MEPLDRAELEKLLSGIKTLARKGIWISEAPNEAERHYDRGFMAAMRHVASALDDVLAGRPVQEP